MINIILVAPTLLNLSNTHFLGYVCVSMYVFLFFTERLVFFFIAQRILFDMKV